MKHPEKIFIVTFFLLQGRSQNLKQVPQNLKNLKNLTLMTSDCHPR